MPEAFARLLLCSCLSVVGCGEAASPTAPQDTPDLIRLDGDLLPELQLEPLASASVSPRAAWPNTAGSALSLHRVEQLQDNSLRLADSPETESFVLGSERVLLLDVMPGELLRVHVVIRTLNERGDTSRTIGGVTSFPKHIDTGTTWKGASAQRLLRSVREELRPLQVKGDTPNQRTSTLHVIPADHTQLAILLHNGGRRTRLLSVTVERLSLGVYLATQGLRDHEVDTTPHTFARTLRLERDERRGLRLDPGTRWRWTLPAHDRAYHFEAALGFVPRDPALGGALQLHLLADGQVLWEQNFSGSSNLGISAWTPLNIVLPLNTRELEFHVEAPSGDGPLAMLGHPRLRRPALSAPPNLLLISLDTLRADRLGAYGGSAPTANLDSFAAQSVQFLQAYAPSAYTLPSHASMLSGQLPAVHGARDLGDRVDPERTQLLASSLADQGYVTAAFTGGGFLSTSFGFGAGFDRFAHNDPCWPVDTLRGQQLLGLPDEGAYELALLSRSGAELIGTWLDAQPIDAPFFAFVHTYAAHNYAPNQRWLARAGLLDEHGTERPFLHNEANAFHAGQLELRDTVFKQFSAHYDASIGMADDFVGALLQSLEQSGHADNTIVVVTSDHGEEFGEHERFGHGRSLHEGVTQVPLLVRIPGRTPVRVPESVSLADLAPWLLTLLGQPVDPRMLPPRALAPDTTDPPSRHITLFDLGVGSIDLWALREGNLKLVFDAQQDRWELFDLSTPEGEHLDRADADPEVLARLQHKLASYRDLAAALAASTQQALDPETLRQLAQLGYLDGDN